MTPAEAACERILTENPVILLLAACASASVTIALPETRFKKATFLINFRL